MLLDDNENLQILFTYNLFAPGCNACFGEAARGESSDMASRTTIQYASRLTRGIQDEMMQMPKLGVQEVAHFTSALSLQVSGSLLGFACCEEYLLCSVRGWRR